MSRSGREYLKGLNVELKPVGQAWQAKYDKLMKDKYLKGKYNRTRRIAEKRKYLNEITPEIKRKRNQDKLILDIGPGPGEFLEVCREMGHRVIGIDAKIDDCEMGNEYIQLSEMMTKRQGIDVHYIGLDNYLQMPQEEEGLSADLIKTGSVYYINMQGCIEQCFKDYMTGPPHRETKKASGLSWYIEKAEPMIFAMFTEFNRILEDGGYITIWANGAKNSPKYDDMILRVLDQFTDFRLYKKSGKTLHKIRKVS
jgi:hypothetical protein